VAKDLGDRIDDVMIVAGRVEAAFTLAVVAALVAIGIATLVRVTWGVALVIGLLTLLCTFIAVVIAARAWDPNSETTLHPD
jgi:hypothetical protein